MFRTGLLVLALLGLARGECPNACSGHGDCSTFDKCTCFRNWQAADCSERTCPFGTAHVDTPKGDLDGSADELSGNKGDNWKTVIVDSDVYKFGTTEQYPHMQDTSGNRLTETAHAYSECSNKGLCDRASGLCKCMTGYEGHACQRASCPNSCSGHGTCETIEDLARWDNDNVYMLWDRKSTMGCKCDAGYEGPDCSLRQCKVGVDPLYTNLNTVVNYPSWEVRLTATEGIAGTYAIKFYDSFGEDYLTAPITHSSSNYCPAIKTALEALPNSVIPQGSVACTTNSTNVTSHVYILTFTGNPGELKQIEINTNLDGSRPTLYSLRQSAAGAGGTVTGAKAYVTPGSSNGEYTDYFTNYCEGVTVTVNEINPWWGAATLSFVGDATKQAKLLKQCLGDSDGNPDNNVDYENWDRGDWHNADATGLNGKKHMVGRFPHAIKLVRADGSGAGHTNLLWYSTTTTLFKLLSKRPTIDPPGTKYRVFTTDGVAQQIVFDYEGSYSAIKNFSTVNDVPVTAWWNQYTDTIYTNIDASCESGGSSISTCFKKGDKVFLPAAGYGYLRSPVNGSQDGLYGLDLKGFVGDKPEPRLASQIYNTTVYQHAGDLPYTGQVYTITKIWTEAPDSSTINRENRFRIKLDKNINWSGRDLGAPYGDFWKHNVGVQYVFKFDPNSTYTYVSECANRGSCDRSSGLCQCFKGYTGDSCSVQNALAV